MARKTRKFTEQEKLRYLAEFKELQKTEDITIIGFAERAGISHYTFSNWLYRDRGNVPGTLVKVGKAPPPVVVAAPPVEVRIEYFDAVIRTDLTNLASVLSIIRNA